ncbi:MAG: DMT family transporter [Ilumatobacteraceae bacterium]
MSEHVPLGASVAALASGVVWSFGAVTARLADDADAFQYLIWRSIAILLVVEVLARTRRQPSATVRALRSDRTMLLACASLLLASIAFVYAVKTTTPANAAFLSSITPLVAVLLARVVLREPLTPVTIVAVAVAFVGLVITVVGDVDAGDARGNIAALLASVGFAGYAVCVRTSPRRDWSPVLPGYAAMMIVICAAITLADAKTLVPPATDIALAALHGGVFIVVGTLLFNLGARRIPAVAMAVLAQTEMLFVPVWGFLVLDLEPTTTSLIGGLVIFGAVIGKALYDARPAHRR